MERLGSGEFSQQYMDALSAFQAEEAANSRKRKPEGEATQEAPPEKKSEAGALFEKAEALLFSQHGHSELERVRKLYKKAAALGHGEAAVMAGKMYLSSSLEDRITKAKEYFTLGLDKTEGEAEWQLSELYNHEEWGMANSEEREKLLIEGSKQNHTKCSYHIASIYMKDGPESERFEDGYIYLCRAAEKGYAQAQLELGQLKYQGRGDVEQCYIEARKWFERAANQGNFDAKKHLGLMYIQGIGGVKLIQEGLQVLRSANRLDVQELLASIYLFGRCGVQINNKMGIRYLEKAVKGGSDWATKQFAKCCENGLEGALLKDEKKALEIYKCYAEKGEQWGYFQGGSLLISMSTSSPEDIQKGIEYLEKVKGEYSLKAKQNLAFIYYKQGSEETLNKAIEIYEELLVDPSVDQELNNRFRVFLAKTYLMRGKLFQKKGEEYKKVSFELFYKAAHLENIEAFYLLGRCYRKGLGVEKNLQEAFRWNIKAADRGVKKAQFYAGLDYYYGQNNQNIVNLELAAKYLGESESEKAYYYMGLVLLKKIKQLEDGLYMLISNEETIRNIENLKEKAIDCLDAAESIGDLRATFSLGTMYLRGEILVENFERALAYFTKAANAGSKEAKLMNFMIYYFGIGVDRNPKEAERYRLQMF